MKNKSLKLRKLYIEPTSKCNLQCEMCFRHTWFDESFCEMPYEMFEKLLATMPEGVETIFFGGMGEPLFHPRIIDMIEAARRKVPRVELLTNGTLLDEALLYRLIDAGLSQLWVSVDSLDSTDDEGVGHPMYEVIIDKLKLLRSIKLKTAAKMTLGITFVATKSNVQQVALLPYFINKYGISEVNISNMYPSDMASQEATLYQKTLNLSIGSDKFSDNRPVINLPYMDFDIPQVQEGLKGLFEKMNFNLQVNGIAVPRRSQYCRFVNEGMSFVRSDGNVSPCMALLHNGTSVLGATERKIYHHSFGNVMLQGLESIWLSKSYVDFRKRVIEFSFSPCMNCGHCGFMEENQEDCFGNEAPTCGACLWSEGLLSCP